MRMYDIIKKKRDGGELSAQEIDFFVRGYASGEIPDYQAAALCMAIYFVGMTDRETVDLTFAVRDSGGRCDFSAISGVRADKHSTGGVGDKTSLVVAPIVASLGVKVAKMSGRGLGHTGGTIDKLESIPGFRTELSTDEFVCIAQEVGACIVAQSEQLAPADKMLYALRDVTATVDSMPLAVASIMGKKLAADDDCILLDVKTGSGAIAKTLEESRKFAKLMVHIGRCAGKRTAALITDMDQPLGNAVGNALEVKEAVETLCGRGPRDLNEICVRLAGEMLALADRGSVEECKMRAAEAIKDGSAFKTFRNMVEAQGGDVRYVDDTSLFGFAPYSCEVSAEKDGYIECINAEEIGKASLVLGAGRSKKDDVIDPLAGIVLAKKTREYVAKGEKIATLYTSVSETLSVAAEIVKNATTLGVSAPAMRPLIIEKIV